MKLFSKKLIITAVLLIGCIYIYNLDVNAPQTQEIAIILPLEHAAMNEIVSGFRATLSNDYNDHPVAIRILNAQGDNNLLRALIQQVNAQHVALIATVGVNTTEMTRALTKHIPIVGIATDLSEATRQKLSPCNIAIVHDEISSLTILQLIQKIYPQIKSIALVHSSADKILPEVKEAVTAGEKLHINIHPKMVNSMSDLSTVAANLPNDTEAVLILKDHLIVSAVATLVKAATKLQIPVISSDEGSVQSGAMLALGVNESDTGRLGAELAANILRGDPPCNLPIVTMSNYKIFINPQSLAAIGNDLSSVENAAAYFHYPIESVSK